MPHLRQSQPSSSGDAVIAFPLTPVGSVPMRLLIEGWGILQYQLYGRLIMPSNAQQSIARMSEGAVTEAGANRGIARAFLGPQDHRRRRRRAATLSRHTTHTTHTTPRWKGVNEKWTSYRATSRA